eukprot:TRINITY_DN33607_c0_g1_i1.p3 TRINITY_DN33607_c0_g1~~TRINITY_DN33607_c0_g1_i1.p3  ORF type:complete len:122 (+),score=8.02 TRINITY_DN33607_c0_g1_i1:42-407(+)
MTVGRCAGLSHGRSNRPCQRCTPPREVGEHSPAQSQSRGRGRAYGRSLSVQPRSLATPRQLSSRHSLGSRIDPMFNMSVGKIEAMERFSLSVQQAAGNETTMPPEMEKRAPVPRRPSLIQL